MLSLEFAGWFECRLSTDPDPTDEPRGVSGWTFALPGERNLDRIIRFRKEEAVNRRLGPKIGVTVHAVSLFGQRQPKHPLLGAHIELLDNPVYEGRNGLAFEDAFEPIFPFHVRVQQAGVLLRREHRSLDTGAFAMEMPRNFGPWPDLPNVIPVDNPQQYREARKRTLKESIQLAPSPARVAQLQARLQELESGGEVTLIEAYRERRRQELARALEVEKQPVERLALEKRLRDIVQLPLTIAEMSMGISMNYRYVLQGPWFEVEDTKDVLEGTIEATPWIVTLSAGVWDADALAGYARGSFDIPFRRHPHRGHGGKGWK